MKLSLIPSVSDPDGTPPPPPLCSGGRELIRVVEGALTLPVPQLGGSSWDDCSPICTGSEVGWNEAKNSLPVLGLPSPLLPENRAEATGMAGIDCR